MDEDFIDSEDGFLSSEDQDEKKDSLGNAKNPILNESFDKTGCKEINNESSNSKKSSKNHPSSNLSDDFETDSKNSSSSKKQNSMNDNSKPTDKNKISDSDFEDDSDSDTHKEIINNEKTNDQLQNLSTNNKITSNINVSMSDSSDFESSSSDSEKNSASQLEQEQIQKNDSKIDSKENFSKDCESKVYENSIEAQENELADDESDTKSVLNVNNFQTDNAKFPIGKIDLSSQNKPNQDNKKNFGDLCPSTKPSNNQEQDLNNKASKASKSHTKGRIKYDDLYHRSKPKLVILSGKNIVTPQNYLKSQKEDSSDFQKSYSDVKPISPPSYGHPVDKATIEAMQETGITSQDLAYPSEELLNSYSRDPSLREFVKKQLTSDADCLRLKLAQARQKIIEDKHMKEPQNRKTRNCETNQNQENNSGDVQGQDQPENTSSRLERVAREKFERANQLRKRRAEQLIMKVLEQKLREEESEAKRIEIEKENELREERLKERRKIICRDNRIQEELNARKKEEEIKRNNEKSEKILNDLKKKEDQYNANRKVILDQRIQENAAKFQKIKEQTEIARKKQQEIIKKKSNDNQEREARVTQHKEQIKKEIEDKFKKDAQKRNERETLAQITRERIQSNKIEQGKIFEKKQVDAAARVNNLRFSNQSLMQQIKQKRQKNFEKVNAQKEKKNKEEILRIKKVEEQENERLCKLEAQNAQIEKERRRKAIIDRIRCERQLASVQRMQRAKIETNQKILNSYDEQMMNIERIKSIQEKYRNQIKKENLKLEHQKVDFSQRNNLDQKQLKEIASQYGLNLSEIEQRVKERQTKRDFVPRHEVNLHSILQPKRNPHTIIIPPDHENSSNIHDQQEIQTNVDGLKVYE